MGMARVPGDQAANRPSGGAGHPFDIGTDERRMHVRAYNYWVSLLGGRAYPSIEDLDPANIADFGPNSVLLDFSLGIEDPSIQYLGRALREECSVESNIRKISEVPSRSLLSRLTDHYLQIIANRAPIGFEAEFVGQSGHNTLYRGILMPFSSDDDTIDFIYGVINWKVMVDDETQVRLAAEVEAARRDLPRVAAETPAAWADGPSGGFDAAAEAPSMVEDAPGPGAGLGDLLAHARACAGEVDAADSRTRTALYRALERAYAFAEAAGADPQGYGELLEDAGLKAQARAPMTPIVKLVFGVQHDKTRLTEYAAVLMHARRHDVPVDGFATFLASASGGIKGLVAAERAARRPAERPDSFATAAAALRQRATIATVPIAAGDDEFVLLLARAGLDGMLEVVARVEGEDALTEKAVRRAGA
ncbi:hypothetical protein [Sphingomonas sp.]|uniref:PAS domain-containing protein n=1 Tax=Sphingomonas sp. TaxID=28214 RepID=UPI002BFA46E1|nr:hypothetical protein [Sphingomonas sp.]HTG38170.1 hypothetical protein [Sphingomonas sp.]